MTLPSPKTWSPGLWSAAEMNIEMRDVLGYFLKPPMCIVRKDRNSQTAPLNVTVVVSWDTVVYDNDGIFGVDNSRFTCKTPGYYALAWQIQAFKQTVTDSEIRRVVVRQYNVSDTLIDQIHLVNVDVTQSNESYAGSAVVGLNVSDYLVFLLGNVFGTDNTEIVEYDPAQGRYGCQVSVRWVSQL